MIEDFGRYRLLEEIARGAFGIVYRALDLELDRVVALKTLRHDNAGAVTRERFLREASLAARLSHPHIVQIFETGEHDGTPFYTMPLLEGAPLRGPLPPVEACRLVGAVARAVACAHAGGIVHRDLKPANIVVCAGGPVVTDFGAARDDVALRVTETGELLGTPAYMSPEQLCGRGKEADGKADVYALGVILFELLTGRLPCDAESFVELSVKILNDPAPGLPGFDPALEALVRGCLSREPADRPDASELARKLERWSPVRRVRWAVPLAILAAIAGTALWASASTTPELAGGESVRIPPGAYEVGDPRFGRRTVAVEEFWIDRFEAPARATGYSYLDALSGCLKQGKRLPTEDEWEIAAGDRLFPWGDQPDASRAGCQGKRGPNARDAGPFGCRDMAGNLSEWTATPGRMGPDYRAVRGGHWQSPIERCTKYARDEASVTKRHPTLGYRCASSVAPPSVTESATRIR